MRHKDSLTEDSMAYWSLILFTVSAELLLDTYATLSMATPVKLKTRNIIKTATKMVPSSYGLCLEPYYI